MGASGSPDVAVAVGGSGVKVGSRVQVGSGVEVGGTGVSVGVSVDDGMGVGGGVVGVGVTLGTTTTTAASVAVPVGDGGTVSVGAGDAVSVGVGAGVLVPVDTAGLAAAMGVSAAGVFFDVPSLPPCSTTNATATSAITPSAASAIHPRRERRAGTDTGTDAAGGCAGDSLACRV